MNMYIDLALFWFMLIGIASGVWVLAFLIIWNATKKQFDALAGVVVFVLGASTIVAEWGVDYITDFPAFPFGTFEGLMPAFGYSFAAAYAFSKNIRKSSAIAFTGTLFFGIFFYGFMVGSNPGVLPRIWALLASIPVSSVILYATHCKNILTSIKGSLLDLSILSALLSLIIFAFLKFGNCWRVWDYGCLDITRYLSSPVWIVFIPTLAGATVIKLTGCRVESPQ